MRSYWEGTSLRLFLPRGCCGVIFAARQRFTSIGPLGRLRSQEGPAIQMGGVLPYKLEVYCRTFFEASWGWGFRNSSEFLHGWDFCQRRRSEPPDPPTLPFWGFSFFLYGFSFEPHNPRTTPTKATMNFASSILGVVYILLFS